MDNTTETFDLLLRMGKGVSKHKVNFNSDLTNNSLVVLYYWCSVL